MVQVKICGLMTKDATDIAVQAGADYIGFIFFQHSVRNIDVKTMLSLIENKPQSVKVVAVMVDPSDELLQTVCEEGQPDMLQLHGNETPERVAFIKETWKIPVMKALAISSADDVAGAKAYETVADMLLFDAKAPHHLPPGGNGLLFDWELLRNRDFVLPWGLSGGLNAENVSKAIAMTGCKMVDVSSSVESSPGCKDGELIRHFITSVKGEVNALT